MALGSVAPPLHTFLSEWLSPLSITLSLVVCMLAFQQPLTGRYAALGLLALLLSHQVFRPQEQRVNRRRVGACHMEPWRLLYECLTVMALLSTLGLLLKVTHLFPGLVMLSWFALAPVTVLIAHHFAERLALHGPSVSRRHVIIGANGVGSELALRIRQDASDCHGTFMGYFDYRSPQRLSEGARRDFAGHCDDLATFVGTHSIDEIFIALPISDAPRIQELLKSLSDTTASIYLVPNLFAFDLIQPRCSEISGMPVVAICDTPFHGMNAVHKRMMDLLLATALTLVAWPVMLWAAAAVRLSSPGPVLFKQRRYGLNGEEIVVYKFRTMTVCEDQAVVQAVKDDCRITPVGRFLRRTSLDELPQIFNVFTGDMSFVGPRPHAVAHNEQYRRLISGYMLRHKIRPGITGLAQINGLRGETDTLDKMQRRVECDLEYLRNWSPGLDLKIVVRTASRVFFDRAAY